MEETNGNGRKYVPELKSTLRDSIIELPNVIREASGIRIFGKRIKSIIYTMDVAVIDNNDADAILCVYPWTPNTSILRAISQVAKVPILAGIGGGVTSGPRSARLGSFAEEYGATCVVLNAPSDLDTISIVEDSVDIPIVYTVVNDKVDLQAYIDAGVDIFNVAGGKNTVELVKKIRAQFPDFPIIASGGNTDEMIHATIQAGANAITWTAYGATETYFQDKMELYRQRDYLAENES
ncbi:MAG: hydrolase [Streptococcaceae bacterium]|jgi:2-keto-3-deoxy-6-phosphogluconate aldolase|nr:hydrolase [Streptococcaceae bacterium]